MKLSTLLEKAAEKQNVTVAVAAAEDPEVLDAISQAVNRDFGSFILFGDKDKLDVLLSEKYTNLLDNPFVCIRHAKSDKEAAELSVKAVHAQQAAVLMKGNLQTAVLLKEVLNKDYGLRTGNVLSHVAVFETPRFDRLIFVTDAAMNIEPGLEQKAQIVQNAVSIATGIGIHCPRVAPIAAVEVVNPAMQATADAALLTQMNRRGQIKGCILDGPLALDNAISMGAAKHKGLKSETAGQADILLMPNIETGNVLYKSLIYFAGAKVGGIIAGAGAPIVLTSRSDSAESKLYSIALAICSATNH